MNKKSLINNSQEIKLYNYILLLSRNKIFYTNFKLADTFLNRIHLIFLHISFLFVRLKNVKKNNQFKQFNQKLFDLVFSKIEQNMRELGYGDVTINKNMKLLVKNFYNILLKCENYGKSNSDNKKMIFSHYLEPKNTNNTELIQYFDKYEAFCLDIRKK